MKTTLTSLLMLAAASPLLLADITVGTPATTANAGTAPTSPAPTAPQTPTRVMGNCDLLASNTVRATYLGIRALQSQSFDQATPTTVHVAVFQVVENLAYRRHVRYGDGSLKPGACFTVAMNRALPGQPSSIVDNIAQMQVGEEAIMKIDHLYIFGDQEGTPIRPCTRMARRQAAASPQPGAVPAATPAPVPTLVPSAPVTTAPQPPADDSGDDTTVEHAPQNAAPAPIVAPTPAAPAGTAPASGSDSF